MYGLCPGPESSLRGRDKGNHCIVQGRQDAFRFAPRLRNSHLRPTETVCLWSALLTQLSLPVGNFTSLIPGTVQEVLVRRFEPRTPADSLTHADARFDVIGAPYSLLSVSLSASQNLFTRRGTLVGLSGKADNVWDSSTFCDSIFYDRSIDGYWYLIRWFLR